MSETKMSEIIKASLEGILDIGKAESFVGSVISIPGGITVIPVSKITVGLATGGIDYGTRKFSTPQSFGGGGGTVASITPVAFLIITKDADAKILHLDEADDSLKRISDIIDRAPEIIEKIKHSLT